MRFGWGRGARRGSPDGDGAPGVEGPVGGPDEPTGPDDPSWATRAERSAGSRAGRTPPRRPRPVDAAADVPGPAVPAPRRTRETPRGGSPARRGGAEAAGRSRQGARTPAPDDAGGRPRRETRAVAPERAPERAAPERAAPAGERARRAAPGTRGRSAARDRTDSRADRRAENRADGRAEGRADGRAEQAARAARGGRVHRGARPPGRQGAAASGRGTWERSGSPRAAGGKGTDGLPARFRRRRVAAVALGLLFAVVAGGLGGRTLLYDAGLADVEGMEVTGVRTVPEQAVRDAAAVTVGVPLAGVDLDAIERRVEALPVVAHADAGRDWPHTVTVEVTERVPAGIADTPKGPQLVDTAGVAYLPVPDGVRVPHLAVGVLEPGAPAVPATGAALTVLAALPADLREQVTAVEVGPAPTLRVVLRLTEDREIRFGSPDRATDKVAVLGPLLTQKADVYDVVSPELPTIRR